VEVRTASDGNSFEGDCIDKVMFRNKFRYLISITKRRCSDKDEQRIA